MIQIPNNLTLVVINGCDKCKKLSETLNKFSIQYNKISCDESPSFCDLLESITKTCTYPILLLETFEGNILYYVAEKADQLKLNNTKKGIYILKPYATLDGMIQAIIK